MFVSDRRKKILGEPFYGFGTVKWGYGWFDNCDHSDPPAMSLSFEDDANHIDPPTMSLSFTDECES